MSIVEQILQYFTHHFKNRKCSFRSTPPIIGGVGNILLKKLIDYYSTQNEVFVPKCLPRVACIPNTAQNRNKLSLTPEIELRLSDLGTGYIVAAVDDDNSEYDDNIKLEYLDCILSIQNKAVYHTLKDFTCYVTVVLLPSFKWGVHHRTFLCQY